MGIKFEEKRQIFHLFIKDKYSYYIHINRYNYLIHLYDGKYLEDISKERSSERYMERYAFLNNEDKETCDEDYYFSSLASQFEVSSFGKGDKRGSHTIIVGNDNIPITNFLFNKYEIKKGKGIIKEDYIPHVKFKDNEAETLIITLKDELKEVYLELYYEVSSKYNSIVRYSRLINKEEEGIRVEKLSSLQLDLKESNYNVLALKGTWGNDTEIEETSLHHGTFEISENHGARGFKFNPGVILKRYDTTDDFGECYGFNLLYSSDFKYEFIVDEIDQTRVLISFNNETTKFYLESGESITTFETLMCYSSNGLNDLTQTFHKIIDERIRKEEKDRKEYILLNSWEGYFYDFNTEKLMKVIDKMSELNMNLLVIDDGWFKYRENDTTSLGDWEINEEKIDFNKLISYGKEKGIDLGLWVEPEMVSSESNLFKEHRDYVLIPSNYKNPTLFRHQLVLDLTRDEVIDSIFNKLTKIFDKYDFKYVKWDFNRYLTEAYSSYLKREKREETTYRFIMGTYKLLNKFNKRYPNIILETCSAGGGRFDLGLIYFSNQIWASDEIDITLRSTIQYSKNMFYPLTLIGSHVGSRGDGNIQDRSCLAFFGTFGYELDILKLTSEEEEKIKFFNDLYFKFHKELNNSKYYSIYSPFKTNYISFETVSEKGDTALVYFMIYRKEQTKSRWIKLKGLDKDKYYFNSLTNDIYKGDFYMNLGLNISAPLTSFQSMVFIIKEVSDVEAKLYRKFKQVDGGKRDKLV